MKVVINHDFKDTDGKEYKKGDQPNLETTVAKDYIHQGLAAAIDSRDEIGVENIIAPTQPEASEPILYTNQTNDNKPTGEMTNPEYVKEDTSVPGDKKSKK